MGNESQKMAYGVIKCKFHSRDCLVGHCYSDIELNCKIANHDIKYCGAPYINTWAKIEDNYCIYHKTTHPIYYSTSWCSVDAHTFVTYKCIPEKANTIEEPSKIIENTKLNSDDGELSPLTTSTVLLPSNLLPSNITSFLSDVLTANSNDHWQQQIEWYFPTPKLLHDMVINASKAGYTSATYIFKMELIPLIDDYISEDVKKRYPKKTLDDCGLRVTTLKDYFEKNKVSFAIIKKDKTTGIELSWCDTPVSSK